MDTRSTRTRQSPPLGDLRTKCLVVALMARWISDVDNDETVALIDRAATVADVRADLRRRETLGVGVRW